MKPILKWAGGKRALLPLLLPRVPSEMGTYFEPFAGGAALFFELADRSPPPWKNAVLADWNEDLIETYRALALGYKVIEALRGFADTYLAHDAEGRAKMFGEVRASEPIHPTVRAARFLFLNRTCFNGLYRVNKSGAFNVPHGRYADPMILEESHLVRARRALASATLIRADFADAVESAERGDFVYFDPPYAPTSKSADFTAYTASGFRVEDHARLAALMSSLRDRGVRALLSNADVPEMRGLYTKAGLVIESVSARRSISADGDRSRANELLVRNY